jgi:hypothetical protein
MSMDDDGTIWLVNTAGDAGRQLPDRSVARSFAGSVGTRIRDSVPAPSGRHAGGWPRVRMPAGSLAHFTSTTGPEIKGATAIRGLERRLALRRPVGRHPPLEIVRTDGLTQVRNAYPGSEFIISTDPLFRPVNIKQGPDGAIYIVDMYHGIIQDANWTARGTYLRYKIQQYQLDKVINHGRIWRLRFDGIPEGVAEGGAATQPTRSAPSRAWNRPPA